MNVLLVEDDDAHRAPFEAIIGKSDAVTRLTSVSKGSEFLERIKSDEYDIVLLDYHLPDYTASELLDIIDQLPNVPPVVITSSDNHTQTYVASVRMGGREFVSKEQALFTDDLGERLQAIVQRHILDQQRFNKQQETNLVSLAGHLAHEYNNLLTGIIGKAESLRVHLSADPHRSKQCGDILNTARRLESLTKQLLASTCGGAYNPVTIDINQMLYEVLPLLEKVIPVGTIIRYFLDTQPLFVKVDKYQVTQAVINLCQNACYTLKPNGIISIFSEKITKLDEWIDDLGVRHQPGDYVHLIIADCGEGLPAEDRRSLYSNLCPTNAPERRLALAAVRGILLSHGSGLHIETEASRGTAIHMYMKHVGPEYIQLVSPPNDSKPSAAKILVVEDEQIVSETVLEILHDAGHQPVLAETGAAAVQTFCESDGEFNIILLDMHLPDMNGAAVLETIQTMSTHSRIIICSGYEQASILQSLLSRNPSISFLAKPFDCKELLTAIDTQLHLLRKRIA